MADQEKQAQQYAQYQQYQAQAGYAMPQSYGYLQPYGYAQAAQPNAQPQGYPQYQQPQVPQQYSPYPQASMGMYGAAQPQYYAGGYGVPPVASHIPPQPNRVLYVGHLHDQTDESEIRDVFSRFGAIESVKIIRNRSCAFVTFVFAHNAQTAFHEMQHGVIHGQQVTIGWRKNDPAQPAGNPASMQMAGSVSVAGVGGGVNHVPIKDLPPRPPARTLWVGNVRTTITENHIRELFSQHGVIENIRMMYGRNCAFVTYSSLESAIRAYTLLDKVPLVDTIIRVNYGRDDNDSSSQQHNSVSSTLFTPTAVRPSDAALSAGVSAASLPPSFNQLPLPSSPPPQPPSLSIIYRTAAMVLTKGDNVELKLKEKRLSLPFIYEGGEWEWFYRWHLWVEKRKSGWNESEKKWRAKARELLKERGVDGDANEKGGKGGVMIDDIEEERAMRKRWMIMSRSPRPEITLPDDEHDGASEEGEGEEASAESSIQRRELSEEEKNEWSDIVHSVAVIGIEHEKAEREKDSSPELEESRAETEGDANHENTSEKEEEAKFIEETLASALAFFEKYTPTSSAVLTTLHMSSFLFCFTAICDEWSLDSISDEGKVLLTELFCSMIGLLTRSAFALKSDHPTSSSSSSSTRSSSSVGKLYRSFIALLEALRPLLLWIVQSTYRETPMRIPVLQAKPSSASSDGHSSTVSQPTFAPFTRKEEREKRRRNRIEGAVRSLAPMCQLLLSSANSKEGEEDQDLVAEEMVGAEEADKILKQVTAPQKRADVELMLINFFNDVDVEDARWKMEAKMDAERAERSEKEEEEERREEEPSESEEAKALTKQANEGQWNAFGHKEKAEPKNEEEGEERQTVPETNQVMHRSSSESDEEQRSDSAAI
ncbi:uncharacterized protein MONOS_12460 [Monocercomonoides exilis]|uniref:uncharacterized protein n=1 Tax=Monocercomonoides exilis TaxID=2049356 RepID=UPI003559C870|nr:hypothetical protein MONOS_12460 [Monocercomonoides exilis]|eukprot:MONOS_12460.2-p1 / transcript=MONOS_12460.2 / gene=MONOS_12460 / organism=Monocercomonoides_exilis_PA203 / gene_product=unspecified product / transcript_product=unspecified product / location=Mono_scaffold00692:16061-19592(+) / protein_length=881 / sequence_SO=supercontig / SO=protein_coding / is_pseudo=false